MIRKACKRDIERIMELLLQVNMIHHNGRPDIFKGPVTKYTEDELEDILENDETPVFVYTDSGDDVCGYCFCISKVTLNDNLLMDSRSLYIDDLCVDERLRGKHIGSELLDFVEEYARDEGFDSITLNVWALNDIAHRFYESKGMDIQKYVMEKRLK